MLEREIEYQKMADVEDRLWWYSCLHEHVIRYLSFFNCRTVLDAGCGTGGLLSKINSKGFAGYGIDISPYALNFSKKRGLEVCEASLVEVDKVFQSINFDAVIACDTLCYLEEQEIQEWFIKTHSRLNKDGICIINYPAFNCFMGIHDLSVGIKKRRTYSELVNLVNSRHFKIHAYRYWPFFLSPVILTVRMVQRIKLFFGAKHLVSDVELTRPVLNSIFYWLTKKEQELLSFGPFGSSLFLVLQKI